MKQSPASIPPAPVLATLAQRGTLATLDASLLAMAGILPPLAYAALPVLQNPTRGAGNGILDTLQNYGFDIVLLVALLVISTMFIGVCYHAYSVYSEIHTNRKTWGDFGVTVSVGAVLLVIGIWLLTNATQIL
jgi:integrating conjugative element membrane protein (TIGR03745 family)